MGAQVRFPKFDLRTEVIPGVTYRQVRDLLKASDSRWGLTEEEIAVRISRERIMQGFMRLERYSLTGRWDSVRVLMRFYEDYLAKSGVPEPGRQEMHPVEQEFCEAYFRGKALCDALAREGVLEQAPAGEDRQGEGSPDGAQRRWWVAEAGRTLRAQKLRKRIPRSRGGVLLGKALAQARAFNADPDALYRIEMASLFGSLLHGTGDLGDVDLNVTVYRRHRHLSVDDFIEVEQQWGEREGISISAHGWYESDRLGARRMRRVSPHLSVSESGILGRTLDERGERHAPVYVFCDRDAPEEHVRDYPVLARQAVAVLERLASQTGAPELHEALEDQRRRLSAGSVPARARDDSPEA